MGSQASPGVVGASRCPVWGIRDPGVHARRRRRKRSWVGLSRTSAFLGRAGVGRRTSAWPGQRALEPGSGVLTTRHGGPLAGAPCRKGGLDLQSGSGPKAGPPTAADEPLLSSLPSPPGFPVASAQPGEGKQQLPKTPGPPTGTVLPTPHSLRSCFWSRWFPAAGGGGTRDQLRSRRPSTSVKLQLCVTLGKSLLSEP